MIYTALNFYVISERYYTFSF